VEADIISVLAFPWFPALRIRDALYAKLVVDLAHCEARRIILLVDQGRTHLESLHLGLDTGHPGLGPTSDYHRAGQCARTSLRIFAVGPSRLGIYRTLAGQRRFVGHISRCLAAAFYLPMHDSHNPHYAIRPAPDAERSARHARVSAPKPKYFIVGCVCAKPRSRSFEAGATRPAPCAAAGSFQTKGGGSQNRVLSPPCALSGISGWRDGVFIHWRVAAERRAG
jgi:hypothetical protein